MSGARMRQRNSRIMQQPGHHGRTFGDLHISGVRDGTLVTAVIDRRPGCGRFQGARPMTRLPDPYLMLWRCGGLRAAISSRITSNGVRNAFETSTDLRTRHPPAAGRRIRAVALIGR